MKIYLIALTLLLLASVPAFALKPPPRVLSDAQPAADKYPGEHGELVRQALSSFAKDYEHYRSQAERYSAYDSALRVAIVVCSISIALVLALGKSDVSRRVALALSIVLASLPVLDQQFRVSAMHQISWRTAVDIARVYEDCKDQWEGWGRIDWASRPMEFAKAVVSECREKERAAIDREMIVSLTPIELPKSADSAESK